MITYHSPPGTADDHLLDRSAYLVGFNIVEDAVGSAEVVLHAGSDATDPQLRLKLEAGETWIEFPSDSLQFRDGIYIERVSGTTDVFLYVA